MNLLSSHVSIETVIIRLFSELLIVLLHSDEFIFYNFELN